MPSGKEPATQPTAAESGDRERSQIAPRAGVVALGTLSSRILGLVRDALIAALFTTAAKDAWVAAWTIPNSLRVLLGEGAVSGAFVPVLTEVKEKEGIERARLFFGRLFGAMTLILILTSAAGVALAPWLTAAYAGGYDDAVFDTTVTLTRYVFPYILLAGLAALFTGALNAERRFFAPAFAPALLNVALIAAALLLVDQFSSWGVIEIAVLAVGALVGGVLQMGAQVPSLVRTGLFRFPSLNFSDPYVRKAFRLLLPLLFGLGVYQLNVMLSRLFASFLETGAQTYLYFGLRVAEIPQGMFGFAIATATLPTISAMFARGETDEVKKTFSHSLRLALLVSVPSAIALTLLAEPAIAVLFGRGEFDAVAIEETAQALTFQALGIWAVAAVRTTVPMFHAMNDTKTPVISGSINLVAFVGTAGLLMGPLGHVGIAIGFSVAAVLQLASLLFFLRRRVGPLGLRSIGGFVLKLGVASIPMAGYALALQRLGDWSEGSSFSNIGIFAAIAAGGALIFALSARLVRIRELEVILGAVRRRLRR
ncbi:MAG: murein biosynthesis integral membrane protein MurJ [Myxococcota bacterium]